MTVISLGSARDVKRLRDKRAQLLQILDTNRQAVERLFQTGVIFHIDGSRAGRDLLLAHELLLKVLDAIEAFGPDDAVAPDPAELRKVKRMLDRTALLTQRTGSKLKTLLPPG